MVKEQPFNATEIAMIQDKTPAGMRISLKEKKFAYLRLQKKINVAQKNPCEML